VPSVLSVLLLVGAAGARAEEMTAEAFERFAEGRTLYFTRDAAPIGAEQYFPGRRSLWRFADGSCEEGRWWGEGKLICFQYDGAGAQCWHFRGGPDDFVAASVEAGVETGFALRYSGADHRPLACPGPKVGS
jgi:hypothetical protein